MSFSFHRLDQNSNENVVRIFARKPPGSYKRFQCRNLDNIFIAMLVQMMTPKRHFEINWPLKVAIVCRCEFIYTNQTMYNSIYYVRTNGMISLYILRRPQNLTLLSCFTFRKKMIGTDIFRHVSKGEAGGGVRLPRFLVFGTCLNIFFGPW